MEKIYLFNKNHKIDPSSLKIRSLKGNTIQPIPDQLRDSQNKIYSFLSYVSEAFAQFFQNNNSYQNYTNDFLTYKNSNPLITESNFALNNPSFNQLFNLKGLYTVLQNCNSKSPGPDNIPYAFIQNLPENGITILLEIFNFIWRQEIFHNQWRNVTVIPITKPGKNKFEIPSYRPISLINTMSKILENRFYIFTIQNARNHLYNKKKSPIPQITLNNTPFLLSNNIRILGLTFDHILSWKPHIKN